MKIRRFFIFISLWLNPYLSRLEEFIESPFFYDYPFQLKSTFALILMRVLAHLTPVNCLCICTHKYIRRHTLVTYLVVGFSPPHLSLTLDFSSWFIQYTLAYTIFWNCWLLSSAASYNLTFYNLVLGQLVPSSKLLRIIFYIIQTLKSIKIITKPRVLHNEYS